MLSTGDLFAPEGESPPARRSGMRRRWNRVFATMLVVSIAGAAASTMVVTRLAHGNRAAVAKVDQELGVTARLRRALQVEQGAAHLLLDSGGTAADMFLDADRATSDLLGEAAGTFDDATQRTLLVQIPGLLT